MASFRGVHGVMLALESHLQRNLPAEWRQGTVNARATLLGSADMGRALNGNLVGLYLHRVTVDPHGRNRPLAPLDPANRAGDPELPVNLHFLLIANGSSAAIEADLLAWAMATLANEPRLDLSQVGDSDAGWGRAEGVSISPVEMSDEDLLRYWDHFEAAYSLCVPYVLRSVRLRLAAAPAEGPDVTTRALSVGRR
jgi:hypothetical protein